MRIRKMLYLHFITYKTIIYIQKYKNITIIRREIHNMKDKQKLFRIAIFILAAQSIQYFLVMFYINTYINDFLFTLNNKLIFQYKNTILQKIFENVFLNGLSNKLFIMFLRYLFQKQKNALTSIHILNIFVFPYYTPCPLFMLYTVIVFLVILTQIFSNISLMPFLVFFFFSLF